MNNIVETIFNSYKQRVEQMYDIEHLKTNLMISEEKFFSSLSEKQKEHFLKLKQSEKTLMDEIVKDVISFTIKNNME